MNKSFRMAPRVAIAIALSAVLTASCKPNASGDATRDAATSPVQPSGQTHELLPVTDVVQGASIYPLKAALVDQEGAKGGLDVYRGKVVMISMFYSSCPHACPTLISNLKKIDAALSPEIQQEVRVLLVSFDPENDKVEVLRKLASDRSIDTSRWKLATASEEQVREIAAVLGIKYRRADGSFNHSSVITLLDREGAIDLRSDGLADATDTVAARVTALVRRSPAPH